MSSFQIPVEIIWSLIGGLFMVINSLFWQKLNTLENASKSFEEKIYLLETTYLQKMDETKLEIKDTINELLKAFYQLEIKIMKDFVSKEDCKKNEN